MNTFLPYPDFTKSAKVLDNKRLGKERVECLQILRVLSMGPIQNSLTLEKGFKYNNGLYQRKTPWYNHPATRMWKGYESALLLYMREICEEWKSRGYKDTCYEKAIQFVPNKDIILLPYWFNNLSINLSHQSNLLRKNSEHYGKYFIGIPNNLPYIWPV